MTASTGEESSLVRQAINRPVSDRLHSGAADVERIINATYAVLQRTGTVDPTMRDILKEAGLSTQAFYRYFPSKDDLLLAILDDGRRRLGAYLEHRLARHELGVERVTAWIEAMFAQAIDTEASARTKPFITNRPRLTEQYPVEQGRSVEAVAAPLLEAVGRARADRAMPPVDGDDADAMSAYHLVVARMEAHIVVGTVPDRAEIEATIGFVLRGLGLAD